MKRMVGRRIVDEGTPRTARAVTVYRRWPWLQDEFYSEGEIEATAKDGILVIDLGTETHSYSPRHWRKVVYREVPSRARV